MGWGDGVVVPETKVHIARVAGPCLLCSKQRECVWKKGDGRWLSCLTMEFKLGQERREINNKVKDTLGVREERLIKELNIHLHSRKQINI